MLRFWMFVMSVFALAAQSVAQERPAPPVDRPPLIMLAQAVTKDGDVFLTVSNPQPVFKTKTIEVEQDGKKVKVNKAVCEFVWSDIEVKVDGKDVAAFNVSGKPIDSQELPKRLAKPTRIAVLPTPAGEDRKLDPFYLGALKIGTVVVKIPEAKFAAVTPQK